MKLRPPASPLAVIVLVVASAGGAIAAPVMKVSANFIPVADGATGTMVTNNTEFRDTALPPHVNGASIDRTFKIENDGDEPLILTDAPHVAITGVGAAAYSVTAQPGDNIAPGGSSLFTIRFDPTEPGHFDATVSIATNSPEHPYTFAISGDAIGPEITVTGLGDAVGDDGMVTLREAVLAAVNDTSPSADTPPGNGADVILFHPSLFGSVRTIELGTPLPQVEGVLTITGPGAGRLRLGRDAMNGFPIISIAESGNLTVEGLTIQDGSGVNGGGIQNNSGTVTLRRVNISRNVAVNGAGIYNAAGGTMRIEESTIAENSAAGEGGGLWSAGDATVVNSTISSNASGGRGGGVYCSAALGLQNSTVAENSTEGLAGGGLAVDAAGVLSLSGTIVAANTTFGGGEPDISLRDQGSALSGGHNLVADGGNSGLVHGVNHDQIGTAELPLPANLAPLSADDALPTHFPLPDSPAIDAGSAGGLATDQLGNPRTVDDPAIPNAGDGDGTDIGSVEVAPEIEIRSRGVILTNGDLDPDGADGTDFGITNQSEPLVRIFEVHNIGTGRLHLGALEVTAGFSVVTGPAGVYVDPGGMASFSLQPDLLAAGARTAQASLSSNDNDESPFIFAIAAIVTAPEISVEGLDGEEILSGTATPSAAAGTDFGELIQTPGATGVERSFTIRNSGQYRLSIGPLELPDGFAVIHAPEFQIDPDGSDSFTIALQPERAGTFGGELVIPNADLDESRYTFAIAGTVTGPEIALAGNGMPIEDGDDDPSVEDDTEFAPVRLGNPNPTGTFNIQNSGNADLLISDVRTIDPAFAVVGDWSDVTVPPGGNVPLQVRLKKTDVTGTFSSIVAIESNDITEGLYAFAVRATVENPATVLFGETAIASGSAEPSPNAGTDFGDTLLGGVGVTRTFILRNDGGLPMAITNLGWPGGFNPSEPWDGVVPAGEQVEMMLRLDANLVGERSGLVWFTINGGLSYEFAVSGRVVAPEIRISSGGSDVPNGGAQPLSFGAVDQGDPSPEIVVEIFNDGTSPLHIGQIDTPPGVVIVTAPDATVSPSASSVMTLQLETVNAGDFSGDVTIENDDPDEAPFTFALAGTVARVASVFRFLSESLSVNEGAGTLDVTVEKSAGPAALINFETSDLTAFARTPSRVGDYVANSGALDFPAGPGFKTIQIEIIDDSIFQTNQEFRITLILASEETNLGNPNIVTIEIVENDQEGGSQTDIVFPAAPPPANASLKMNLAPAGSGGRWRLEGSLQWRESGEVATGLEAGDHSIEFLPVAGFATPIEEGAVSVSGAEEITATYIDTGQRQTGWLKISLQPPSVANADGDARGGWRLFGESEWRFSGATVEDLAVGTHYIEFKQVPGRETPHGLRVAVFRDQGSELSAVYFVAAEPPGAASPNPVVDVSGDPRYRFVGQIQTEFGFGTGFVVSERVVLTAAHVLYDDSVVPPKPAQHIRWRFQKHRGPAGVFEPVAIQPDGWYLFDGYVAQRALDATPGVSSPASQNLDVAALYFSATGDSPKAPGRGGWGGYLVSDSESNEWLVSDREKYLAGYPIERVMDNAGKLHATPGAFFAFELKYDNVFSTDQVIGRGGMSGGPAYVKFDDGRFFPAGVYLGGGVQALVRAIDGSVVELIELAQHAADTGENNTGEDAVFQTAAGAGLTQRLLTVELNIDSGGWRWVETDDVFEGAVTHALLPPGEHEIEFLPVPGYQAPASRFVTVPANQNIIIAAIYTEIVTDPFDAWLGEHFSEEELADPLVSGADSARDADGVVLLLEWALAMNPKQPDSEQGLPVFVVVGDGSNHRLQVTHVRRTPEAAPGLSYVVEFTENLIDWQPGTLAGAIPEGDGLERVTVIEDLATAGNAGFGRLRVVYK